MKLTNKQKLSIWKSLKLNEDFFDDNQSDIYDETGFDLEDEYNQQYTYHFQFIFYLWPLIKEIDNKSKTDVYYFEKPEYKSIIESAFISIKKVLEYILQATPIVTDYSKPKFCTLNDKIISIFPFMDNEPENRLFLDKEGKEKQNIYKESFYKEIFDSSISLEMTLNLSDKKNRANVEKLLYSFYKLKLIYNNLIKKINIKLRAVDLSLVEFGYSRNNPFVKMGPIELISQTDEVKCYPSYKVDILLTDYEELKRIQALLKNETDR